MSLQQLYLALLVGGAVVLVGVVAARVAARAGLPSLLLFLGVGILLGEAVLGIRFDDTEAARNLGTAALAVILIEGGLTTRWSDVRPVLAPAAVLATLGVGVSMTITAFGVHLLLGLSWQLSAAAGRDRVLHRCRGRLFDPAGRAAAAPRRRVCSRRSRDSTTRRR